MQTPQKAIKALEEIEKALTHIKWGSIEIFVQDSKVVQITERNIKKLSEGKKG
jgi:hypothetical protein